MLTIDMLRHGELQGGVRYRGVIDDPLTSQGWAHMNAVWRELDGRVDLIISSPLSRCSGPAREWSRQSGVPCLEDERLMELRYGAWEGKTAEEIRRQWPGMLEQWRCDPTGMQPPGGEAPEMLRERVASWWEHAHACWQGRHILVVAHSGSLRMLLAIALGGGLAMTRRIDMPYACWSRVCVDRHGRSWLVFHNRPAGDHDNQR